MPPPQSRSILKMILTNFINSFKPRQIRGNLKGEDHLGNRYYEIPADRSVGRRKDSRWFVPNKKDDFQAAVPSEWEAWLRQRRAEPPTIEEVLKSVAIAQLKQKNAKELAKKYSLESGSGESAPSHKSDSSDQKKQFPTYEEYEMHPGASLDNEGDEKNKR